MVENQTWLSQDYRKLITLTVLLALSTIPGCSGGGESAPITSNLSTTTNATEGSTSDQSSDSMKTPQAEQAESATLLATDSPSDGGLDSIEEDPPFLPASFPEEEPELATNPTEPRVSVRINWDHSPDSDVTTYYVHYGKQPSTELGSCASYEESQSVATPPATISGLEPNTPYFFAISAFTESESSCSSEIMMVSPPISPEEL